MARQQIITVKKKGIQKREGSEGLSLEKITHLTPLTN
jgi:hypothetical protein